MENKSYNTDNHELEQIREEMKDLREALQAQKIFSDMCIRQAMAKKLSWNKRFVKIEVYAIIPLLFLFMVGMRGGWGISWPFIIISMIMIATDVVWDVIINRLKEDNSATMPLIELKERLIKQKKMRRQQMAIEIPLLICWIIWLEYEIYCKALSHAEINPWIPVGITVALFAVSITVAFAIYNKMQGIDETAIAEIDDLRKTE